MARNYLCWPGFEHNQWLADELVKNGCEPDIHFPITSGRNPRFWVWAFTRNGKRFEIQTDYGRLVRGDLERMLNMSNYPENATR